MGKQMITKLSSQQQLPDRRSTYMPPMEHRLTCMPTLRWSLLSSLLSNRSGARREPSMGHRSLYIATRLTIPLSKRLRTRRAQCLHMALPRAQRGPIERARATGLFDRRWALWFRQLPTYLCCLALGAVIGGFSVLWIVANSLDDEL